MQNPFNYNINELKKTANIIRQDLISMLVEAGSGHTAGPLGMADIFTAFYFNLLRYEVKNTENPNRDRLILSNGHICPIRYVAMARAGYFPLEELKTLRKFGSRLQGHPHRDFLPMLESSSGPLGSGLSQAVGMALADKIDHGLTSERRIYALLSDGEQDCGQTWEAAMLASKEKLQNLVAVEQALAAQRIKESRRGNFLGTFKRWGSQATPVLSRATQGAGSAVQSASGAAWSAGATASSSAVNTIGDPGLILFIAGLMSFWFKGYINNPSLSITLATLFMFFSAFFIFKGKSLLPTTLFWVAYLFFGIRSPDQLLKVLLPVILVGLIAQAIFMKLLKDITSNLKQPDYEFGRPTLPLSDMAYSSVMKVFTTFSLRRFMSDMQIAKEKGYVNVTSCYASVGHFMQKKEVTPLLVSMVTLTSLPLRTIEKDFAIDSTGFGTSNFQRWYSFKHGKEISSRRWVKCHFITGTKTNIIPKTIFDLEKRISEIPKTKST